MLVRIIEKMKKVGFPSVSSKISLMLRIGESAPSLNFIIKVRQRLLVSILIGFVE